MVYKALVLDNSQFLSTGKIRVRVSKYYYGRMRDLSEYPDDIKEGLYYDENHNLKHTDTDAYVYSPIGGATDYGMFFVPQVNSEGVVLMMGDASDNSNEFLWLGSLFEMDDKKTVKMPSDSMNNVNGIENGSFNSQAFNGSLVLKLRSTYLDDPTLPANSKEALNWKKAPIENLVVLNRKNIIIEHSILDTDRNIVGNSIVTMDDLGTNISVINKDYTNELSLNIDGTFKLGSSNIKDGSTTSINSNGESMELLSTNASGTTLITQEPEEITLSAGNTAIGIKDEAITLKSKSAVYLDAPNVRLGPDNLKVVLCPANVKTIPLSEGLVLSTSDVIYG